VDPLSKKWWLFEATPDIKEQLEYFREETGNAYPYLPAGVFITHAHIGHYTGLMQFGREVIHTKEMPVYVLPRMKTYLETNGPWSQLVALKNITLSALDTAKQLLNEDISVSAFTVPHRDEYSETAGFKIYAGNKTYLFIPDINKWSLWSKDIKSEVMQADIALLDATFYDTTELPGRKMDEVPHPLVTETMLLFSTVSDSVKSKIYFIHLNHTNPLLWDKDKRKAFKTSKYNLAKQGQKL
jgi:pyrroloquinoline quinone biosynthesis protein B